MMIAIAIRRSRRSTKMVIGGCAPSRAAAATIPQPHRVAADRGWQGLMKNVPSILKRNACLSLSRGSAIRADHAPPQAPRKICGMSRRAQLRSSPGLRFRSAARS